MRKMGGIPFTYFPHCSAKFKLLKTTSNFFPRFKVLLALSKYNMLCKEKDKHDIEFF